MNPVRWRTLSGALFVLSLVFLAATVFLPTQKYDQLASYRGPAVSYYGGDTAVSGYYIPPVQPNSKITVSLYDFIPGSVDISIFITQMGSIAPVAGITPLYLGTPTTNQTIIFPSQDSQPIGMYVISHNRTSFILRIHAIYSPFFWLSTYTSAGVILTLGTGVLLYYYTFTARRWKLEQKAIEEATQGSDSDYS